MCLCLCLWFIHRKTPICPWIWGSLFKTRMSRNSGMHTMGETWPKNLPLTIRTTAGCLFPLFYFSHLVSTLPLRGQGCKICCSVGELIDRPWELVLSSHSIQTDFICWLFLICGFFIQYINVMWFTLCLKRHTGPAPKWKWKIWIWSIWVERSGTEQLGRVGVALLGA